MKINILRTLVLALFCTLMGPSLMAQQNIVKFKPVALFVQTNNSGLFTVPKASFHNGFAFERVFTEKISAQINLDFVYAFGFMAVIKPEMRIYLLDVAPHGLYAGGYTDVGLGGMPLFGFGYHWAIGPEAGYQMLFFNDRLAVDGTLQMGIGVLGGRGYFQPTSAGFNMAFSAAAGYAF